MPKEDLLRKGPPLDSSPNLLKRFIFYCFSVGENCVLPNLNRAKGILSPQAARHGGRSQNAPTGTIIFQGIRSTINRAKEALSCKTVRHSGRTMFAPTGTTSFLCRGDHWSPVFVISNRSPRRAFTERPYGHDNISTYP